MRRPPSALLLLLAIACGPARAPAPPPSAAVDEEAAPRAAAPEHWAGTIESGGMTVDFTAHLVPGDDGWTGTLDVPLQGAKGAPLTDVHSDPAEIRFTLTHAGVTAVFAATRDGAAATGTLTQDGQEVPIAMRLVEDAAATTPKRPQTPRPPFPYAVHEVSYPSGDVSIAGTLTVPEGPGPHPAALLITGSGAQDRDETLFDHKPFAVIADHLGRNGIAVLRVDDRGVGGTGGVLKDATSDVLVDDVLAGVAFLGGRPELDPERIGLIGHSEGGILGPIAASRSDDVAFVVMLAGTGLPGREILLAQGETLLRAAGANDATVAEVRALQSAFFDAVEGPEEELRASARALIEAQLRATGSPPPAAPQLDEMVDAALKQTRTAWFRSFVPLDPRPALAALDVPVLALVGSLDFQVAPDLNLPPIREALAKNPDATVEELEGLNHLFQHAETGLIDEYPRIEETIAPEVLERVTGWIRERTGVAPR